MEISSSGGGLHTKRLDTVCVRKENVHHDDVEGAYTEIIEGHLQSQSPEFTVGTKRISLHTKAKLIEKAEAMRVPGFI